MRLANAREQFDPAHAWHFVVRDHEIYRCRVRRGFGKDLLSLARILSSQEFPAFSPQTTAECRENAWLIIH